jgi:hypothetical protein
LLAALRSPGSGWYPVFDLDKYFHFFTRGTRSLDLSVLPESLPGEWNKWADHWVRKNFVANVRIDPKRPSLRIRGDVPDLGAQPIISIEGPNNRQLDTIEPPAGRTFETMIPLSPLIPEFNGRYIGLRFRSNLQLNPHKMGQSDDDRDLSWRLYEFVLSPDALPEFRPGDWNKWTDYWVKDDFIVKVLIDPARPSLRIRGDVPDLGIRPIITIKGPDEKLLDTLKPAAGSEFESAISLAPLLPQFKGKYGALRFQSSLSFNPRKLGQSSDDRDLSWRLHKLQLSSGSSAR